MYSCVLEFIGADSFVLELVFVCIGEATVGVGLYHASIAVSIFLI